MDVTVGITIDADGTLCGLDCPWMDFFGVKPGSDEPQMRCSLCDRFLNVGENGEPLRCGDCIDNEMRFKEKARQFAMRNAVQNKENGVRLLEATGYKFDLTAFESVTELFKYLIERKYADRKLVMSLTGLNRDELDKIMNGCEYPFLISRVQAAIGVPSPKHMTSDEEMAQASQRLRGSEI